MYCKNCGKEIAEDSKFCQHCGALQSSEIADDSKTKSSEFRPKFQLSSTTKFGILIYVAWFFLNFACIYIGGQYFHTELFGPTTTAYDYFYPFAGDISCYDFSEFLVYAIVLPIIIIVFVKVGKKLLD